MNIEKEVFKKVNIDFKKLLKYGFKLENGKYVFIKNILKDTFKVEITIYDNLVIGKIWDLKTDDEYTNFRTNSNGEFSNIIKEEYIKILEDIRVKCCDITYFEKEQANRVCNYIIHKYNDYPDFMWEKFPGYGVFKNKLNNKWYAVILNINKSKFTNEEKEVEVINLKVKQEDMKHLLKRDNFYPGYHMNKKSWVTIILDDKIEDNEIFDLVDNSYNLIDKVGK